MRGWSGVPLRLRVALAFALSTAVALVALGVFLHLRVAATLDDQTRASLDARADALVRLSATERDQAVRELSGESFGQVLDAEGRVLVSSSQLRDPLLRSGQLPETGGPTTVEAEVFLDTEGERGGALLHAVRTGPEEVVVIGVGTDDVAEVLEGLRTQLVLGGTMALLLAAALGYVVAGIALRPMERMRARATTISARSSDERLPLPEVHDEVYRLGLTLNQMLDRLDAGLRRERRFVAEASHELRTPLALLRTELDLAASRPRPPEELAAFLSSAIEEVDRLSLLVDHLLLLAEADDARLRLDLAPLDVRDLLAQVAARFAPAAEGRMIAVTPGPPVQLEADRRRVDQAVSNLVDNALRHGRGAVTLNASRVGDQVVVTVSDEGGGANLEEMFDRFRRGEASRTGGRGLGLSLVEAIVTEHGGTVRFDEVADGTVVTVALPG